jgi:Uma2 family endonuclease
MPVEAYPRLTDKPYSEYRDGVVSPKSLPTKLHSIVQRWLLAALQNQGAQAFPELTVRITPSKYLVPDISVTGDFPGPYRQSQCCCVAKFYLPKTG